MELGTLYVAPKTADLPPKVGWPACDAAHMARGFNVPDGCEELDTSVWGSESDTFYGVVLDTGVDESPRLVGRTSIRENGRPCGQGFGRHAAGRF